jgi:hypothetical protein
VGTSKEQQGQPERRSRTGALLRQGQTGGLTRRSRTGGLARQGQTGGLTRQSQAGELPIQLKRLGQREVPAPVGYLLLFVFGVLQGLIGSFQFSQSPAPLIAIVLVVILFVTCLACGWGFRTFAGGLVPALGWVLASFIMAMPRPNGSVVITATAAGEWYLYGGALACLLGSLGSIAFRAGRRR